MGLLQSYGLTLLRHPSKVLFGGVATVVLLFILTIYHRATPSFREPLAGFETRNTPISQRINTWNLLIDEASASTNNLSVLPIANIQETSNSGRDPNELIVSDISSVFPDPPLIEESRQHSSQNSTTMELLDEDEEDYYRSINATLDEIPSLVHHSVDAQKAFCGKLSEGYVQIVVAPTARNSPAGLFNLNSMLSICQLDRRLRLEHLPHESTVFTRDCERFLLNHKQGEKSSTTCCNSWSLPNFITCLNNKTSCMQLDQQDMRNTEHLVNYCVPYYFRAPFEECFNLINKDKASLLHSPLDLFSARGFRDWPRTNCGSIPEKCLKCNGWIFNVMNYLVNENFIVNRYSSNQRYNKTSQLPKHERQSRVGVSASDFHIHKLSFSNIFLPIAKSSSILKYYHTIAKQNLKTKYVQIKAMDFGLKNSLFEHLVSDDAKLFIIALALIVVIISVYTWSIILAMVILMIICLSLCLSYVIYETLLNIPVFPFMNLLAVVISFGICSDNAMLFCKHWSQDEGLTIIPDSPDQVDNVKTTYKEQVNLDRMLRRAVLSTFVATLATGCSFIITAISRVVAVRCFCIFASLSVVTNYFLIVLLLPPALILDYRFSKYIKNLLKDSDSNILLHTDRVRAYFLNIGDVVHRNWIYKTIINFKLYFIITFVTFLACASILVFYRPTLQPSDQENVQLLSRQHPFEQYDRTFKRQFAFERAKLGQSLNPSISHYEPTETLPVRIVFGVIPADNGNHLDPLDRGSLVFDPKFDFSDTNTQIWLLKFCQKLQQQRFIHPFNTPDSTNCFIDSFKSWMETRSCRDPIQTDNDRSPCCQAYEFPYTRRVLDKCIGEAVNIMRKTPQFQSNLNGGLRFFKNTTRVASVIIEYQSNRLYSDSFTKMQRFFNDIDEWVTWQINNTAPAGLKSGWFVTSDLDLMALQTELDESTISSILLEVVFAMMALFIGTRDLVLTMAGSLTVGTVIIVAVAILILLKWTLGVAESILITLTIGLSIDFALHYCVAFSESKSTGSNCAITHKILTEIGSPIALATITTSTAGFVIVWSDILAYQQLGVFLMLIALTSWTASTFFLLPMLATISSLRERPDSNAILAIRRGLKMLIDRL